MPPLQFRLGLVELHGGSIESRADDGGLPYASQYLACVTYANEHLLLVTLLVTLLDTESRPDDGRPLQA